MTSQWRHRNKTQLVLRIKFPTKCIFRIFYIFRKLTEWRCFVTYLSDVPRRSFTVLIAFRQTLAELMDQNCDSDIFFILWRWPLIFWPQKHCETAVIGSSLETLSLFAVEFLRVDTHSQTALGARVRLWSLGLWRKWGPLPTRKTNNRIYLSWCETLQIDFHVVIHSNS